MANAPYLSNVAGLSEQSAAKRVSGSAGNIRIEIEGGKAVDSSHLLIAAGGGVLIAFLLTQHVREKNLGVVYAAETGFKLKEKPDTVRAADATFVAKERIPAEGEPRRAQCLPQLYLIGT